MKRLSITVLILLCNAAFIFSQTRANDIVGLWLAHDPKTNEKTQMEIFRAADGTYEAKVVWVENKKLSHEVGTIPIRNLTFDSKNREWRNGKVNYDGSDYSMTVNFTNDGRLKLRGFLGVSLLGRTVYWTKEKELRK